MAAQKLAKRLSHFFKSCTHTRSINKKHTQVDKMTWHNVKLRVYVCVYGRMIDGFKVLSCGSRLEGEDLSFSLAAWQAAPSAPSPR